MVYERDVGTGGEVAQRAGGECFLRSGEGADPCRNMNGDPGDVVAEPLDLAGVKACADLDAVHAQGLDEQPGAPGGTAWTVERDEYTVSGALDQLELISPTQRAWSTIGVDCRSVDGGRP